ncbi:prepilin peptidase [Bellilinea sp.]|uniref:prepilin peptidase n=1 Tax=Bellilinea sp. TaxID=2838785 RepID=UPI002ADDF47C|nr:prepilin peptidase [Bellilinea sp.]
MWLTASLVLWLTVCAVQDLLRRQVSNWLTLPAFLLAGLWAVWHGGETLLLFGLVTLIMVWSWQKGVGAADGKIMAVLAVFMPAGFLLAVVLRLLVGGWLWMRHGRAARFPAVPVFAAGAVLSIPIQFLSGG